MLPDLKEFSSLVPVHKAAARGISLNNKAKHTIARLVQSRTNPSGSVDELLNPHEPHPDLDQFGEEQLANAIASLMVDKIITEIFCLDYDPASNRLLVTPFLISRPEKEDETLQRLYQKILTRSARAARAYMELNFLPGSEDFFKDLQADLDGELDHSFSKEVLNLQRIVDENEFRYLPWSQTVEQLVDDISRELIAEKLAVEIPGYGLYPALPEKVQASVIALEKFMRNKIYAQQKKKGNLVRLFEKIHLQQLISSAEKKETDSLAFLREKTLAIRQSLLPRGGQKQYPGALTLETLLAIIPMAAGFSAENDQRITEETTAAFLRQLKGANNRQNMLLFLPDKTNPAVLKKLFENRELVSTTWFFPEGKIHAFCLQKKPVFQKLVIEMANTPPRRHWQILVLRALLEKSDPEVQILFQQPDFARYYGFLLRLVYINDLPFFLRVLLSLHIKAVDDQIFLYAKKKIMERQKQFQQQNEKRDLRKKQEDDLLVQHYQSRLQQISNRNLVLDQLDRIYLQEHEIPTLQEINLLTPDLSEEEIRQTLKTFHFQLLTVQKGDQASDKILLYPADNSWPWYLLRLYEVTDIILDPKSKQGKRSENMKRASLLKAFLSGLKMTDKKKTEDDDPYEKFEQAMLINEEREENDPLKKYF